MLSKLSRYNISFDSDITLKLRVLSASGNLIMFKKEFQMNRAVIRESNDELLKLDSICEVSAQAGHSVICEYLFQANSRKS